MSKHPDFPIKITDEVLSPSYVIAEDVIERNCQLLASIQERANIKILLALKAFALPALFPLIGKYLSGVCASGAIEARLGDEYFRTQKNHEVHTYAPAYTTAHITQVLAHSDYVLFNSINQWHTHKEAVKTAQQKKPITIGLRLNPGYAEVETDLYNPCLPGSRFGLTAETLQGIDLTGISGFHFHALCEQGADVFMRVLANFEQRFKHLLNAVQWLNFGGGHHITRADYDVDLLCSVITDFQKRHPHLQLYMEPGEAVVLNGGVFVTTVLDILPSSNPEIPSAVVLDCSAETHLPDVLAMPYRPEILGAMDAEKTPYTYRLGGISCLSGDIIGDYSFSSPLKTGERLVLTDMALYSFVKNTTFNGVELPSLYRFSGEKRTLHRIRSFDYNDYLCRIS